MYEADGKFHRCDNEVVFASGTVAGLLNILENLGGCKQKWRKGSCTNLRNSWSRDVTQSHKIFPGVQGRSTGSGKQADQAMDPGQLSDPVHQLVARGLRSCSPILIKKTVDCMAHFEGNILVVHIGDVSHTGYLSLLRMKAHMVHKPCLVGCGTTQ